MDAMALQAGFVVALVALYRWYARPPDSLIPFTAVLAGMLVHTIWSVIPAELQETLLAGAALGVAAVGSYAGGKTFLGRKATS